MADENTVTSAEGSPRLFVRGGRDYSVDILRCISCLIVVLVHATRFSMPYYGYDVVEAGSTEWHVLAGYMALFSSPTDLFVMVSGIFFLTPQRNVTPKKLWTKNIPKMACAYIFWTFIYALYRIYMMGPDVEITPILVIREAIIQPTHMWYIPMIICLYILAPFFRCITKIDDMKLYKYGLILFVGALTFNTIVTSPGLPKEESIELIASYTPIESICQYSFWMVLGYYLYTHRIQKKNRKWLYIAGVLAIIASTLISWYLYATVGYDNANIINGKFTITTFFKNTALFVLITCSLQNIDPSPIVKWIIKKISACTLIIYLIHWLFLCIIFDNGWLFDSGIGPLARVWIYGFVVYFAGAVVAFVFQLVPWKKIKNRLLHPGQNYSS